ncbi:unnamed protein product [Closterium sp. NIES-54]
MQQKKYQMLAFMVLNRCVSPPIRMSISGFSQQEKAGQLSWAYILSTYQARDALHASLLQTQLAQLRKGDDAKAESYCNRAHTIQAELLTIGQEVHMATFAAHVLKVLPPEYGFLRCKLNISIPDMTVERVCSEVLMEEQPFSIEQSYNQITSDASAFSGAVNTIVATKGGRCYNCNEEGHMAAKCPNKKKDATPATAANVAEGDGKGMALTVACLAANLLADDKDLWFLDSRCSQHMTGRKDWFTVIHDPSVTKSVKGFDGSMQEVAGVGEVLLEGTNGLHVTLHDVLFVPGMKANLVSPGQLTDKGANLQTKEGVTRIITSGGQVASTARYCHHLLCLDLKPWPASNGTTAAVACNGTTAASTCNGTTAGAVCNGTVAAAACTGTTAGAACNGTVAATACNGTVAATVCNGTAAGAACIGTVAAVICNGMTKAVADGAASLKTYAVCSKATPNLWHACLGHVHFDAVKRTATSGGVLGMDLEKGGGDKPCTSCHEAKLTRESFPLHDEREEQLKSDVLAAFKEWLPEAERQTGMTLKVLRSDRGGEFMSNEFLLLLKQQGILHQLSCHSTPQQKGVAECRNRMVTEGMRVMLGHMGLKSYTWHSGFQQFLWVVNRVHQSTLPHGVTPYLVVFKVKADVSMVRVFGCMVQYLIPEHEHEGKLASKTRWGMHLGMSMESKGWRAVDVESQRMVITRNGRFYDMSQERWQKWHARVGDGIDQPTPPFALVPSLFPEPHNPEQNPPPPRTVIVVPVPSVQGGEQPLDRSVGPFGSKAPTAPPPLDPPSVADSAPVGPEDGPLEVGTRMADHEEEEEEEVVVDEQSPMAHEHEPSPAVPPIQAIPPPPRRKTVSIKWLLKKKLWPDGTVEKYKARLVAKGFCPRFGINYDDTYAPVGSYTTVRVLLSIAAAMDMDLLQLDVKNAFLHGTIDHEIYMQQPPYFTDGSSKVCLLQKSLYGLKQSPLLWSKELDKVLLVDQALYYKDGASGKRVWLLIYVDDLLAASEDQQLLQDLKELLAKVFQLREVEPVERYLGLQIVCDRPNRTLLLHQNVYVVKVQ